MKRREILLNFFEACNNGRSVAQVHCLTIKTAHLQRSFFAAKLNTLYAKYSPLENARKLFDETPHPTVYVWNNILKRYCCEKQYEETLSLFSQMVSTQAPDHFTVPVALKACAGVRSLNSGRAIHGFVKKNQEIDSNLFVGSSLIEFYSKCGEMAEALRVFNQYSRPDIVLWTTMITGYEQNSYPEAALSFFTQMVTMEHVNPDTVTLVSVVSACSQLLNQKAGTSVHGFIIRRGFEGGISLSNALLNLYAKTDSVHNASNLFRKMDEQDVISWASMISCYAHNGFANKALSLFNEMLLTGLEPNTVTLIGALQACEVTNNLEQGKKIHEIAKSKGFELDVLVSTALIDMYMTCSSPNEAIELFERIPKKDEVSWSALLCGCVQNGISSKAMGVFCNMLSSSHVRPDAVSMVKILTACSELGILQQAFCLHGFVIKGGFNNNVFVGASLIELYSKCSSLEYAIRVFQEINHKDIVIWSSMIAGYGIHGKGEKALDLFKHMIKDSTVCPNNVTFLSILSACSHSGLVKEGIELFNRMVHEYELKPDSKHYTIMVDLFGRIGELDGAIYIINQMPKPIGPHVWGALLGACRIHQNSEVGEIAAKKLFELAPDHSGYYILMSNIYAVDGKWEDVENIRGLVREKGLKKVFGESVVEIKNEVHSFVANDTFHPNSEEIYGLLRMLELKMRGDGYVHEIACEG